MLISVCGSGMFIPDPSFFHPGSASRNLSILTQKKVSKLSEIWSGLFIPDPDPDFLPIPDPGVKKAPEADTDNNVLISTYSWHGEGVWVAGPPWCPPACWAGAGAERAPHTPPGLPNQTNGTWPILPAKKCNIYNRKINYFCWIKRTLWFCIPAVLRILIWISKIGMFLGLLDPDTLVRGTDPDPSIIKQNSKKNLDSYCFELLSDFLSVKTEVNEASKSNKRNKQKT